MSMEPYEKLAGDQKGKREVEPLPSKEDPFWINAEVNRFQTGPNLICKKGGHKFIQREMTAECISCPAGYNLGAGGEVKDGHIYIKGELLI